MPSSYPAALDSSFPGYPYVDNTEYILSSYANAWIQSIQAIQTAIGFGTGSIAANPLYSAAFVKTFSNITARTAYTENLVLNQLVLDTTVGDIQPVGTTPAAGNSGKAADAKHAHLGVVSVNGRSGAVVLQSGDTTASFTAPGQILVSTGVGVGELLAAGATGSVLTVQAGDASGLAWAPPGSAGVFAPGDLKFTSAFVIQNGWLAANAQAVSRSTYANLMTATTVTFTGTGSGATISGLTSAITQFLAVGMDIEGSGLGASGTITSVSATSINVSPNPSTGSHSFTVFPNGNGDGSTTFQVIDMRGRVPIGIGGSGSVAYAMGQLGGESTHTLSVSEMPTHTHGIYDPGHGHGVSDPSHAHNGSTSTEVGTHIHNFGGNQYVLVVGASSLYLASAGTPGRANAVSYDSPQTDTASELESHYHVFTTAGAGTGIGIQGSGTGVITQQAGSGSAHNNVQPSTGGQYLVKT
jgi:microcystin-dependent protein